MSCHAMHAHAEPVSPLLRCPAVTYQKLQSWEAYLTEVEGQLLGLASNITSLQVGWAAAARLHIRAVPGSPQRSAAQG